MKTCDFCGKESDSMCVINDIFAKFLPLKYVDMCHDCEKKINDYLWERRPIAIDHAWRETAAFAVTLKQDDPKPAGGGGKQDGGL